MPCNKIISAISLFGLILSSNAYSSLSVNANISSTGVTWLTAVKPFGNGSFTTAMYAGLTDVPPTQNFIPGALQQGNGGLVTLVSGGESITAAIDFTGVQYQAPGSTFVLNPDTGNGTVCQTQDHNQFQYEGEIGCLSEQQIHFDNYVYPFSFIRPIFSVDEQALINAFEGKPSGIYTGTAMIQFFNEYYRRDSGVRARHITPLTVNFSFDYQASYITNVTYFGETNIVPIYDTATKTTSGISEVEVNVTGLFTNGVTMSLEPGKFDYLLVGPQSKEIPYWVSCLGCDKEQLVGENGKVMNQESKLINGDANSFSARIRFGFEQIDYNDLETGKYSDNLILMFEPDL